jgi:hypothetical protein
MILALSEVLGTRFFQGQMDWLFRVRNLIRSGRIHINGSSQTENVIINENDKIQLLRSGEFVDVAST